MRAAASQEQPQRWKLDRSILFPSMSALGALVESCHGLVSGADLHLPEIPHAVLSTKYVRNQGGTSGQIRAHEQKRFSKINFNLKKITSRSTKIEIEAVRKLESQMEPALKIPK